MYEKNVKISKNQTHGSRYRILWTVMFVCAFLIVTGIFMLFSNNHSAFSVYKLEDGWDINYAGHRFHNVSKNDSRFDNIQLKRNEAVIMRRRINIDDYGRRLTLRLYSRMSSVRVSVINGSNKEHVIFRYGFTTDRFRPGEFLGTGYHFIQLPQNSKGMILSISVIASKDNAFKGIPDFLITESDHAMEYFADERSIGTFITIFMLISGLSMTVLSILVVRYDRKFYNITLIGLFSAISGIWCMCSMKAIELFSINIRVNSLIEYTSLYFMTIPLMHLSIRFMHKAGKMVKAVFAGSMTANIILFIIAIISQYTGLTNIDTFLPVFHVIIGIDALSLTIVSIVRWRKAERSERFFEIGILFAACISVIYMLYFYFKKSNTASDTFEVVIIPMALLFMVITMFLGYISDVYIKRVDDIQKKKLMSLAYTDEMTGLGNRAMGEKILHEADGSGGRYLIINMDLNFLKKVNDTAGHAAGDSYINTFASIIKDVFGDADKICRMGGDEFLIMYMSNVPDEGLLEKRFLKMENMEKDRSASLPDGVQIDAAYGYAYSDDVSDSASVYRLSDKRMYMMKTLSKKGRAD